MDQIQVYGCIRTYTYGYFSGFYTDGIYALRPSYGINDIYGRVLNYNDGDCNYLTGYASADNHTNGQSVRFIYTGGGTPGSTITDYDGNSYDVVTIGSQYWTKQNWKCTHLDNGTALEKITDNAEWIAASTGDYFYCAPNNNDIYI